MCESNLTQVHWRVDFFIFYFFLGQIGRLTFKLSVYNPFKRIVFQWLSFDKGKFHLMKVCLHNLNCFPPVFCFHRFAVKNVTDIV